MPIVQTANLTPESLSQMDSLTRDQIYCCMDSAITHEISGPMNEAMGTGASGAPLSHARLIYDFECALQGPVMEMALRGWRVDPYERKKALAYVQERLERLEWILERYSSAVWNQPLNPASPKQLIDFFYKRMGLPEQWESFKGVRKLSTNREALEKLSAYFHAGPIVGTILAIRDLKMKERVLLAEIDADGRWRTSFNIGGTETGRLSSSTSVMGTGGNLQNQDPWLRRVFVADPGWKIFAIDYEQAEARDCGWLFWVLFGDPGYLDAVEAGDLHTNTARLVWRSRPWPELAHCGAGEHDAEGRCCQRGHADLPFYRHFSLRDMAKRGAHMTNYYATAYTGSRILKIPLPFMQDFQARYFAAYPAFQRWYKWISQEIQTKQYLITPLGRLRHFFGRPREDATLREAIAFTPQSTTGDRTNLGMYRVWHHMRERVQLLGNGYDAIYGQFREGEDEGMIRTELLKHLEVPFTHNGRTYICPGEYKSGWNWASYDKDSNSEGLMKFKSTDTRKRGIGVEKRL